MTDAIQVVLFLAFFVLVPVVIGRAVHHDR